MAKAAAGRLKSYASGIDPLNEGNVLTLWKKTAMQKWVEGEISNFQYLMVHTTHTIAVHTHTHTHTRALHTTHTANIVMCSI
jgi:hypothetical protein